MGEVRWAKTGFGSSWKLSGGSMWSSAVTNVSKKRQVRRALRRSARASASEIGLAPASGGGRLAQRAIAGDNIHRIMNGTASRPARLCAQATTIPAATASCDAAGHALVVAAQTEPGRRLCLRRGHPLEQSSMTDEQPVQRPRNRVGHQPRLMRQQGQQHRDLRQSDKRDPCRPRADGSVWRSRAGAARSR